MFSSIIVLGQKNGNRSGKIRSYICKVVAVFINEKMSYRRKDLEYSVSVIPVCFLNTEEK